MSLKAKINTYYKSNQTDYEAPFSKPNIYSIYFFQCNKVLIGHYTPNNTLGYLISNRGNLFNKFTLLYMI